MRPGKDIGSPPGHLIILSPAVSAWEERSRRCHRVRTQPSRATKSERGVASDRNEKACRSSAPQNIFLCQLVNAVHPHREEALRKSVSARSEDTLFVKTLSYNIFYPYAIQKKSTGFYCLLEFKGEPTIVEKLETGFRRDEKVIRYITVKEDKHMVAWAEKRRAKLGKKEEA